MEPKAAFLQKLRQSLTEATFVKLTLSKATGKDKSLKNVYARRIELKGAPALSFTLRSRQQDTTKNHSFEEAIAMVGLWMGEDFLNADLFTLQEDVSLQYNRKRKPRLHSRKPSCVEQPSTKHNQPKQYLIQAEGNAYLHAMGITTAAGKVRADSQRKFRQINKYIEIVDHLLQQHGRFPQQPHIVDTGSGKGYLTFALYDHLVNNRRLQPSVLGIELRQPLVDFCNELAPRAGFTGLQFRSQNILDYQAERIDMLIALHACDIATDIAIAKGIRAKAEIIIVAPCCHKQVRQSMQPTAAMNPMLRHGILEERQAEIVTDGIRALLMEAHGYETKVFEFVSTEHTPKNLMIVGVKGKPNAAAPQQVARIKEDFGLERHYLEELLEE